MGKLEKSQFLIPGAELKATKLRRSAAFEKAISETTTKQHEILRTKMVNDETLKLVIQL